MGTFDIEYSQRLPSGRSTAAPITADVGAEGRAIAQAGGAVFGIGQQIQEAEDAMEFSDLKRKSEEIWNAAYNTMATENDSEIRAKVYQKAVGDMNALQSKSGRVQQQYQIHLNNAIPQYDVYSMDLDRKMRIRSAKDSLELNGQYLLEQGDLLGYEGLLREGLRTGLMGQEEYEYRQKNAPIDTRFSQARVLMDSNPDMAIQILENIPDLTGEQLDQKDKLVTHALSVQNRRRKELEDLQDQQLLDLYTKVDNGEPITWAEVNATDLPATGETGKTTFWKWYENQQQEKARSTISQTEEGDPIVNAQILSIIDLKPNEITERQIYGMVDKGLGTNKLASYVSRLRQNKKVDPVLNKYRTMLSKVNASGLLGNTKKIATANRYVDLSRKLDAFLTTKPTDEQAQKFFSGLIVEDARNMFGVLSGNELPGWDDSPLAATVKTEEGKEYSVSIRMGDIVEVEGQRIQAVGREGGQVQWRTLNPQ